MRFSVPVVLASAALASAQMPSICDKYTTALLKDNTAANQYTLLKLLVNTALIGNFTGPGTKQSSLPGSMNAVQGILSSTGPLIHYFDGSLNDINMDGKAGAMNFLDGGGATPILADPTSSGTAGSNQSMLIEHLWQYFGALLGCSKMDTPGFPAYAGDASMYEVHRFMALDSSQMTYFIKQVGDAATSFGASAADAMAAGTALTNLFDKRCAAPSTVIKAQGAQLNAICIAADCAEASPAMCAAYSPVVKPVAASPTASVAASSAPAAASSAPAASQITDGQVQATTAAVVTQITDGQVQATTAVASFTGGAAMPTMAAQVALAAGAFAAAML